MKRILFIKTITKPDPSTDQDWVTLQDHVTRYLRADYTTEVATFSDLAFLVDGKNSKIWSPRMGWDLADFDLVVFRRVGLQMEKAISAAHYLHAKNTPFIDEYLLTQGKGKLAGGFMRAAANLPVPRTFYASAALYKEIFSKDDAPLTYPFVLKADDGRKGYDNYLIHDYEELVSVLDKTKNLDMIAQQFIPNDGDMRVLVLDGKIRLVMLRKGDGSSHLNNTSQGGSANLLNISDLSQEVSDDCVQAAQLEGLQVAGVDVVIDKVTGEHYFLEVNRAPQLATGAFIEEKLQVYADMIDDLLTKKRSMTATIGRVELLHLQATKMEVPARIDTGARTSAIWASNIHVGADDELRFTLFDKQSEYYTGEEMVATEYQETVVASSNGVAERRFKVKLSVTLHGRQIRASFTLADRSNQVYPILVGRNLLNGKFLVDVKLGNPMREYERLRTKQLRQTLQEDAV